MAKLIIYKSNKCFTSVKPVNEGWEHLSLSRNKNPGIWNTYITILVILMHVIQFNLVFAFNYLIRCLVFDI